MSEFTLALDDIPKAIQLIELSDDTLYEMIAPRDQAFALPGEKLKAGRERLNIIVSQARKSICGNETIRLLTDNPKIKDGTEIILAVAAVIKATLVASPYLLAAVLIIRYGLHQICQNEWKK